jgi:hypothetical protein
MYLEKTKRLIIWNGGSINLLGCSAEIIDCEAREENNQNQN